MIPSKKKKVHQKVHHYTLSTTQYFIPVSFACGKQAGNYLLGGVRSRAPAALSEIRSGLFLRLPCYRSA